MFVKVRLLNGFQQSLTYKIPAHWQKKTNLHDIISVPLQKRIELAYITQILDVFDQKTEKFTIKEALEQQPLPPDSTYHNFVKLLARYYYVDELIFYKRLAHYLDSQEGKESPFFPPEQDASYNDAQVQLTAAQAQVMSEINRMFDEIKSASRVPVPIVIHGVTGSGKTEIYKKIAQKCIAQKKIVLLLLPEVSLAVRFTQLFKLFFEEQTPVFGFHSATSKQEKRALWQHLYTEQPAVIIGVHLPLLLPIPQLGAIIIDEEHDVGYQEKKIPRIHTKEAALLRAQLTKVPVILGSATPSLNSLYNVEHKGWRLLELKERFKGAFPAIKVVQLDKKNKHNFWISKELEENIRDRIKKKEQTIIFLNRRGYSFFVQCLGCDYVFTCNKCSVSLTYHEPMQLMCHYCGLQKNLPPTCPDCKEPEKHFLKKGIGTQQVVTLLQKLFPHACIARADLDSTVNKKKWQQIVDDMQTGNIDILVGTQTITKGYHFPRVTLVGIIWADSNIHFPFYASAETTLAQIIQVAGRAGRETENGLVIVQTMAPHPIFSYINEQDYLKFYAYESAYRKELRYPPYVRFAEIEFRHENEDIVAHDALFCAEFIQKLMCDHGNFVLLGPAKPPVYKIQNVFMQKLYIKSPAMQDIIYAYQQIDKLTLRSKHFFTPNPLA